MAGMVKAAMANVVRVRDVMTEGLVLVPGEATVEEASVLLMRHRIAGAPVLLRGRLAGVVSRTDLLDPRRRSSEGPTTVAQVMTRVVYAVRANDPVMVAVRLMLDEEIHRAIVVNDDGSLAGIVAPTDILRALARGDRVQEGDVAPNLHHDRAVAYLNLASLRG